jgi:hypothetical protein
VLLLLLLLGAVSAGSMLSHGRAVPASPCKQAARMGLVSAMLLLLLLLLNSCLLLRALRHTSHLLRHLCMQL